MTEEILERDIEQALKNACKDHNWLCYKTTSIGISGFPDRLIIADGQIIFCELKRPNKKPRVLQKKRLAELIDHGASAVVVHDFTTLDMLVHDLELHITPSIANRDSFYIEEPIVSTNTPLC